jgi:glycosyltransferase involved in cell wall biosynthesis
MADPFVHLTARRARIGLATSSETAQKMRRLGTERVEVLSQVALSCEDLRTLSVLPIRNTNPFRLISLGRLLHWKGFHLGLAAFVQFQRDFPESEYWIIGDGPERSRLDRLAKRMGVAGKVTLFGAVSRARGWSCWRSVRCCCIPAFTTREDGCASSLAAERLVCVWISGPATGHTETGIAFLPSARNRPLTLSRWAMQAGTDPCLADAHGEAARCRERAFCLG